MYSLLRETPARSLLLRQAPTLVGSLLVAELFYKFGSFSLEALAFLATWFVLDAAFRSVVGLREEVGATVGKAP